MALPPAQTLLFNISLRPIKFALNLLGIYPIEFHPRRVGQVGLYMWKVSHSICLSILTGWLLYRHFINKEQAFYYALDGISFSLDLISSISLAATHLIAQWESSWKSHYYKAIFADCESLRQQIAAHFHCSVDYARIRLYSRLLYVFYTIYMIAVLSVTVALYVNHCVGTRIFFSIYLEVVIKLKLFEFILFVVMAMGLIASLRSAAEEFVAEVQSSRFDARTAQLRLLRTIFILQELHARLWVNMRRIGGFYEWSLPALLLKLFIDLTILSYWIWISSANSTAVVTSQYCISLLAAQTIILFILFFSCASCEIMDRQLRSSLHGIVIDRRNVCVTACLRNAMLQLQHERIYVTAGGFLTLNRTSLAQISLTLLTYVVILIQFRMSF